MASNTRAILSAVATRLAAINGTGVYVNDLSASGRVRIGSPGIADGTTPPCAWVGVGTLNSEHGPQLGRYKRVLVLDIEARVGADGTPDARALAAADLLDDLCATLESDRTLGGTVLDVIVTGASFAGDEYGIPGCAIAMASATVYWHAISGAGV